MSALPHEDSPRPAYADAHRLEAGEGPQTLAELRAALAAISPATLTAFNAELDAARFGTAQEEVISRYRRTVAFASRPEIAHAIAASLDETADARPVSELWAHLDGRNSAA